MPDDLGLGLQPPADDGLAVHPLAAIFPMMTDIELAELAADIKDNGQQFPIILDQTGTLLVDGRNRLAACRIAGVTPRFEQLPEGQDAGAYIISANVARRHLDKGQQAMATALLYPEPAKGGRGKRSQISESLSDNKAVAQNLLSRARLVLRDRDAQVAKTKAKGGGAPVDNVAGIMNGTVRLDGAYHDALARQEAEQQRAERLEKLRKGAPELATQVEAEELPLSMAEATLRQRLEEAQQQRRTAFSDLQAVLLQLQGFAHTPRGGMAAWLDDENIETEFRGYFRGGLPELLEKVAEAHAGFTALAAILREFQARGAK